MIPPEKRQAAIDLIEESTSAGARQDKGCELLEINSRTLRRWKKQLKTKQDLSDQRKISSTLRTPANKLKKEDKEQILQVCNLPEFQSLPPSQIIPRLADKGQYIASESSFYRVLKEVDQVNRRGRAEVPKKLKKPKGYRAVAPRQIWSWDITYLASSITGKFFYLYLIMDIYSRKIVGWEIQEKESAEHASQLIRRACLSERIGTKKLVLHSDNGSPMKGATMLATLQKLGIVPSFSRPSVSDDNPYSESLFRTLKYSPIYPNKPFESVEAARKWVHSFVNWYNKEHRHCAIKFVTPEQRHRGEDGEILKKRQKLYQSAKKLNPQRWSGDIRNWEQIQEVWLNPPKEEITLHQSSAA
ncbi:MAG: IS3 family transposase [Desulfuromonadales bacterium]|nr:IS3 family transposase [Desulfuromonadales bacterium]